MDERFHCCLVLGALAQYTRRHGIPAADHILWTTSPSLYPKKTLYSKVSRVVRLQQRQIIIGLLMVAAFPFFFYGGPEHSANRSWRHAWDLGHIVFFYLASPPLYSLYRRRLPHRSYLFHLFATVVSVFLIGLGIECIQYWLGGRTSSAGDIWRNLLGCCAGLVFICNLREHIQVKTLLFLKVVVMVVLGWTMWPFTMAKMDEVVAEAQFPLLSNFETPFEHYRWRELHQVALDKTVARQGEKSLRVNFTTRKYSGVSLSYFPRDWGKYTWLFFSVYNPEPTELLLIGRIHDVWHKEHGYAYSDRFNRRFILHQGWNDLQIALKEVREAPESRQMDMERIEVFRVFVREQPYPRTIHIDNIYLAE